MAIQLINQLIISNMYVTSLNHKKEIILFACPPKSGPGSGGGIFCNLRVSMHPVQASPCNSEPLAVAFNPQIRERFNRFPRDTYRSAYRLSWFCAISLNYTSISLTQTWTLYKTKPNEINMNNHR